MAYLLSHSRNLENKTLQCSEKKVGVGAVSGGRLRGDFNFAAHLIPPTPLARQFCRSPPSGDGSGLCFGFLGRARGGLRPPAAGLSLPTSSSPSLNYEGWGMAASLITMTDCLSTGVPQTVILVCARYKGKGKGHFSLALAALVCMRTAADSRRDWLGGKRDVARIL